MNPVGQTDGATEPLRVRTARGAKWLGIHAAFALALGLVQLGVLARLLPPEDFGLLAMVAVAMGLMIGVAELGVSGALIQRRDPVKLELDTLYWMNVLWGACVFVAMYVGAGPIARAYGEPELAGLLRWSGTAFLVTPWGFQYQTLLHREMRFALSMKMEMAASAVGAAATIALAYGGAGVYAPVWGGLALSGVKTVLFIALGRGKWRPGLGFSPGAVGGYLRFGLFQTGGRALNFLGMNLDKALIGGLLGMQALGYYSVAYQLAMRPMSSINPVVTGAALPAFSAIQDDPGRLGRATLEATEAVAHLNAPVYMGLFAVAGPLVGVYLGQEWAPSVSLFQVLLWYGLMRGLCNPVSTMLIALGRVGLNFLFDVASLLAGALVIWVCYRWGVRAIAAGLVVAESVIFVPASFVLMRALLGVGPGRYAGRAAPALLMGALTAAVAMGAGYTLRGCTVWGEAVALVVMSGAGALTYAALMLVFRRDYAMRLAGLFGR